MTRILTKLVLDCDMPVILARPKLESTGSAGVTQGHHVPRFIDNETTYRSRYYCRTHIVNESNYEV